MLISFPWVRSGGVVFFFLRSLWEDCFAECDVIWLSKGIVVLALLKLELSSVVILDFCRRVCSWKEESCRRS